jgi:hypothetical protein
MRSAANLSGKVLLSTAAYFPVNCLEPLSLPRISSRLLGAAFNQSTVWRPSSPPASTNFFRETPARLAAARIKDGGGSTIDHRPATPKSPAMPRQTGGMILAEAAFAPLLDPGDLFDLAASPRRKPGSSF